MKPGICSRRPTNFSSTRCIRSATWSAWTPYLRTLAYIAPPRFAGRLASAAPYATLHALKALSPGRELGANLLREHEANVLVDGSKLRHVVGAALAEEGDELLHQLLRGARPRGDAHGLDAVEPLLPHLGRVVDQVRGSA